MRRSSGALVVLLALAACGSSGDEEAAQGAEIAFPIVSDFEVKQRPRYDTIGFAGSDATVPEWDEVALVARVDGDALRDA